MLSALQQRLSDPDGTVCHRAIRVAIALPLLFAFGLHAVGDPQFALVAAFGSFAGLGMADYAGPARSRLTAYLVLALGGGALVVLGTLLSQTVVAAVLAMGVIAFALQFLMALGGQFALGNNAAILAFVLAVMVPAGPEAIASRVAGWLTAMACSALLTSLLWPRHERRDLYERLADACRALAAATRSVAEGHDPSPSLADASAAIAKVQAEERRLGYRVIGPPTRQQALLGIVDTLAQGWRFTSLMAGATAMTAADRDLARAVAATLDDVAAVARECAADGTAHAPDLARLIAARHAHHVDADAAARRALAANASGASVVAAITAIFPLRVLSYITLSMAVDASVMAGHSVSVDDDIVVIEPARPEGTWAHGRGLLAPHLSLRSVWLRNCARAGLALALAVLAAKVSDIAHAFWVVLATLSVLRSNAVTTGATVMSALLGTLAGFVLATVMIMLIGPHALALWLTLPLLVFLAGYAPQAISFGSGQAMFALLVVGLFNLMVPEGWETGVVRVEAVLLGAVVALVASLVMWPKGASAALREEVAQHMRAANIFVASAFAGLLGRADAAQIDVARTDALAVRHRTDEAFAAYLGERGAKRVTVETWSQLIRVPIVMRLAADAAIALQRSGYAGIETGPVARLWVATLGELESAFGELAQRLDQPTPVHDSALDEAMTEVDLIGGSGARRAAILDAVAAYADAHRADAGTVLRVMATVWGAGWLGYLAHFARTARPAVDQVASRAAVPWWR